MELTDPPKPMTIREAIEAAKIVAPHTAALRGSTDGMAIIHRLFDALQADHPMQVFRLLSLMHHVSLEALAAELQGRHPSLVVAALGNGLISNPLPDLMNFAAGIGLAAEPWTEAPSG